MAMKFWFGKKETVQEVGETTSSNIQTQPVSGADSGSPASVTGQVAAEPQPIPPASTPSPEAAPLPVVPAAGGKADVVPVVLPQEPQLSTQGQPAAGGAAVAPGPVPLKAVGGTGGSAVRLSVRPAGTGAAVPPAGEAAGGRAVFGLRPKGGGGGETAKPEGFPVAVAVPAEQPKTAAVADYSAVRPKTDQRALYYELMNGLYDAILILDEQGHVVDCSKRITDLLGYSREDAWDLPIEKIITGMSSQMFAHLKRNLAENHHILIDARCFRQDGTSFAGEVGVSTLSLTRGDNIVFAIRNVERRKNAMDELRKCQAALEVALVPAFVCDTDGFFQVVNQALLDSFGIPDAAQSKSVRFVDLLPDAARIFLRAACGEKVREKMTISTPDGQPLKLELSLAPVQSGTNITGVSGSILQL